MREKKIIYNDTARMKFVLSRQSCCSEKSQGAKYQNEICGQKIKPNKELTKQ